MYQRFIAVGRLGRDPEITTTAVGNRMASFSLATSEVAKGEERAEWHRVVVWDERLVDVIERRARKGTLVALEGQIRTRRWSGRDGKDNHSTEVVLDRFTSRFQVLSGARSHEETVDGIETNQPVFDKRFAFDELPF
jgi:single-strand DNA-binding protein